MQRLIARLMVIALVLAPWHGLSTAHAQRASDPVAPPSDAAAAPSTAYELSWYTIAGGAGLSTGGSFALDSSIGQPAAGALSGGSYSIQGGFWGGAALALNNLYLPLARN